MVPVTKPGRSSLKRVRRILGLSVCISPGISGKEAAICAGLDQATGDAVILMDGDLQHPPEHIPEMIRLWQEGYDIVEGVKLTRGKESLASRINARIFMAFSAGFPDMICAMPLTLSFGSSGCRAMAQTGEHDTFFAGFLPGWATSGRPSPLRLPRDRPAAAKVGFSTGQAQHQCHHRFFGRPVAIHYVSGHDSLLFFDLGVRDLGHLVQRWSGFGFYGTVIMLELLIGGSIMLSLGLIGIYINRIFTEVKSRPRYIIADSTN